MITGGILQSSFKAAASGARAMRHAAAMLTEYLADYGMAALEVSLDLDPPWVRDGMPEPFVPSPIDRIVDRFEAATTAIKQDVVCPIARQVARVFGPRAQVC